jgi:hypothetical protein
MYKLIKLKDKTNNIAYKEARIKKPIIKQITTQEYYPYNKKIPPECRMKGCTGSPSRPI